MTTRGGASTAAPTTAAHNKLRLTVIGLGITGLLAQIRAQIARATP